MPTRTKRVHKPRVIVRCVANTCAAPNQRIIKFAFPDGTGGLISLQMGWSLADTPAVHTVEIYRHDANIRVIIANS